MQFHVVAAVITTAVVVQVLVLGCSIFQTGKVRWNGAGNIDATALSLIAGLQIILGKSDVVMLRGLVGAEDVAIYFIANQLGASGFSELGVRLVKGPMMARAAQMEDWGHRSTFIRGALFVFYLRCRRLPALLSGSGFVFGPGIVPSPWLLSLRSDIRPSALRQHRTAAEGNG